MSSPNNNNNHNKAPNNNPKKTDDDDDEFVLPLEEQTNRPPDLALHQQRIPAWFPILDPLWVIIGLFYMGIIMVPVGFKIQDLSDSVVELKVMYDAVDFESQRSAAPPGIDFQYCGINTTYNARRKCNLEFVATEDMEPPILVHYELTNFHQNHKNYYTSRDPYQLLGRPSKDQSTLEKDLCEPLNKLGNTWLNPCGLIANTFFNDIFRVREGNDANGLPLILEEEGIAWESDLQYKYSQTNGFDMEQCDNPTPIISTQQEQDVAAAAVMDDDAFMNVNTTNTNTTSTNTNTNTNTNTTNTRRRRRRRLQTVVTTTTCDPTCCDATTRKGVAGFDDDGDGSSVVEQNLSWSCNEAVVNPKNGLCYRYHYPDEDTTQYLYETYPDVISPLEGVTNEHFVVWMRVATLPQFRKLYGYFQEPIRKGTRIVMEVESNYVVESFAGSKSIIISTNNIFGGKNFILGQSFYTLGFLCLVVATLFTLKHWLRPRKLADRRYLHFKED